MSDTAPWRRGRLPERLPDGLRMVTAPFHCHACGKVLGHLSRRVLGPTPDPGSAVLAPGDFVAPVGPRPTLEPGFVYAQGHHSTGVKRWLKRGRDPLKPSPSPRLPFVVTCSCGADNTAWLGSLGPPPK
jgi:hypothetical protein